MNDKWMNYVDAAQALGMSPEGVRQRARREQWRRQLGNDKKALILVPGDASRSPPDDAAEHQPADRPATSRAPAARPGGEVEALQARIADLRADLDRERAERERERLERVQERDRADRMSQELTETTRRLVGLVDEMRELATFRERLAAADRRHLEAEERYASELEAWKARPWWKRLAG
jgi:molecular chaperone GrpE (heat shock protein)